jgi:hypothetical protein
MHKTQPEELAQLKRGFAMTTTDLRPLTHAIQDAQAAGWRVGVPPWVAPVYLRVDADLAAEMVCGNPACGCEGLSATFLHRPEGEGYRVLAWCRACGMAEDA